MCLNKTFYVLSFPFPLFFYYFVESYSFCFDPPKHTGKGKRDLWIIIIIIIIIINICREGGDWELEGRSEEWGWGRVHLAKLVRGQATITRVL